MNYKRNDTVKPIIGELSLEFRNVKTGKVRVYKYTNMFVTLGKNAIAQRMAGQSAGDITYCALGTSVVAPALGDTALTTEIARKLISVRGYSGNVFTAQTFFTTSEGNGTLKEAGLFGNAVGATASATSGSGQLYARTNINRTKTSNDTLTLTWTITVG